MDPLPVEQNEMEADVDAQESTAGDSMKEEVLSLEVPDDRKNEPSLDETATPLFAPTTPAVLIPSLRGTLSTDGINHVCKGVWALCDDYHILPGQTSDFEFRLVKASPTSDRSFPMNGKYQGYFYLKQAPPAKTSLKIDDREMNIVFTKLESGGFSVEGEGSNRFGKFTLRGTLDESGKVQMYRIYEIKPLPPRKATSGSSVGTPLGTPVVKKRPAVESSPRPESVARVRRKASFGSGFDTDEYVPATPTPTSTPTAFSPRPAPIQIPPVASSSAANRAGDAGRSSRLPQHLVKCGDILKEMVKQPQNIWFLEPVDYVKLNIPDYPLVIKEPMDLGTIRTNLEKGVYSGPEAFAEHVRLVFKNALTYNQLSDHPVHIAAKEMSHRFEERFRLVMSQLGLQYEPIARKQQQKVGSSSSTNKYAKSRPSFGAPAPPGPRAADVYLPPPLDSSAHYLREMQRRMEEMQNEIMQLRSEVKQNERRIEAGEMSSLPQVAPLTYDEKTTLISEITRLPPNKMVEVVEIIKESMPMSGRDNDDDIEIPLDDMDTATLRKLQRYVAQEAIAAKRKRSSSSGKGRASSGGDKKRKSGAGALPPAVIGGVEDEVEAADLLFSADSFEDLRGGDSDGDD